MGFNGLWDPVSRNSWQFVGCRGSVRFSQILEFETHLVKLYQLTTDTVKHSH